MICYDDDIHGYDAYKTYIELKLHFTRNDFNFFDGHESRASKESYLKRRDRYQFYKLGKKYQDDDLVFLLAANMMIKPNMWVGELFTNACEKRYIELKRKVESINYIVVQEFEKLLDTTNDLMLGSQTFLSAYECGILSLESLLVLDKFFGIFSNINKELADEKSKLIVRCEKYRPFITIMMDESKLKNELRKTLLQYGYVDNLK